MSYEPNHAQARTAALAAKHAVRSLSQCLAANQREISPEDVDGLTIDMREILTSAQTVLHEIETATYDGDEARDVHSARRCVQEATYNLTQNHSVGAVMGSGDGYTRITKPYQIEELTPGRELVVSGTVFRIWQPAGQPVRVAPFDRSTLYTPEDFIEQFLPSRFGILLRD